MWNGNNFAINQSDLSSEWYNAITPDAQWMVVNGSGLLLGGHVTTPTSGYTEDIISGSDILFHGPFKKRMLLGNGNSTNGDISKIARRIHIMRRFHCAVDESYFAISYQYVYCRSPLHNFRTELFIDVNGARDNYTWYDVDGYHGDNVPNNFTNSGSHNIDGISFYPQNTSNMLDCDDNQMANSVNVSYTYSSKVNSTDPILVHIHNVLRKSQYWFMVGNVEVECIEPTPAPTNNPTTSPTVEVVSGTWYDDFVYVDKEAVTDFGSSEIYDNGWYVLNASLSVAR